MKELFLFLLTYSIGALAETQMQGPVWVNLINQKFGAISKQINDGVVTYSNFNPEDSCILPRKTNADAIGSYDIATGHNWDFKQGPAFWNWYFRCLKDRQLASQFPDFDFETMDFESNALLTQTFKDHLKKIAPKQGYDPVLWKSIPQSIKKEQIKAIVTQILPPLILTEMGITPEVYADSIYQQVNSIQPKTLSANVALQYAAFFCMISDEFIND